MSCCGADHDISTTEDLLNDGLRIADALDLFHTECLVESCQDSAFATYSIFCDNIELIFANHYNIDDSEYDDCRNQKSSEIKESQVHFPIVPNYTADAGY